MQPIDWSALSRLVPEIVLVVIFVWFTLERDKRLTQAEQVRDTQRITSDEKRDQLWRDFLKEQQQQINSALGRIAEEVKAQNVSISANTGILIAHDNRTTQAVHTAK